ncbi:MAG TPA: SIS domain-containing protein [Planctomycetota bacterium]|nr:SIS domain-containing protein [Planctomycetota bacterium]
MNTKLMGNILSQPRELIGSLKHTLGPGRASLDRAARILKDAQHVFITGIGSSWHAGMAVQSIFAAAGRPAQLVDASELLHFTTLPANSAIIALSRSGKSVEIVKLLDKAAAANASVVGVTNTPDSPLGKRADAALHLSAAFDHNISITMYSALTLVGGLAAAASVGQNVSDLAPALEQSLLAADAAIQSWRDQAESSSWFEGAVPAYLLARGAGMASASETRLLWEEGAKAPACAMTTGGFRHGPQEIIYSKTHVGLWLDQKVLREQDLSLIADIRRKGVKTMIIGQNVPGDAADLVFQVPAAPQGWQFLVDIIPGQIAAERLARLRKVDCDNFLYCPYIIDKEGGL